ncbi:hypothetical protein IMG5_174390 [Ichthyophthirius multifiliis]|uniref:Choline transporter-like protein n=1 Tax=Ichthyophthirius multifiliis TaxID=5932 RepID=G0R221_ICHMU|nr:hypothetical protein IMG5_174390 [Ichthyophthirius multifiliis]EGR28485.1 hypothetical protein IMG5_174390 [Ichthyophthirius multifiliis]|eukprot:XP_004029721.1 hypothetical protein IMG5_174390 [Ichthyophthirius multifiliis]
MIKQKKFQLPVQKEADNIWKYIFLIIFFLVFIVGIIQVIYGNSDKISQPYDPDNRQCGIDDLKEYPYIYFATPDSNYLYRTVCVKECPQIIDQPELDSKLDCAVNSVVKQCKLHLGSERGKEDQVLIYDSRIYFDRVCLPKNTNYYYLIKNAFKISTFELFLNDVKQMKGFILIFCCIAFIFRYIFLFNFYFQIFLFLQVLVQNYFQNIKLIIHFFYFLEFPLQVFQSQVYFFLINIIIYLISNFFFQQLIIYFILFLFKKGVPLIIDNFQFLQFVPIISFSFSLIFFVLFFYTQLNIFSNGNVEIGREYLPFDRFSFSFMQFMSCIVVLFGFIWCLAFFIAVAEYIAIQATLLVIFDYQKTSGYLNIISILKDIFRYRLGTILKGSLLVFLFDWLRVSLELIDVYIIILYIYFFQQKKRIIIKNFLKIRNQNKKIFLEKFK